MRGETYDFTLVISCWLAVLDQNLKQRLVGAAVLIALAVIIIPLLLRGPGEPSSHEEGAQARKRLVFADTPAAATALLREPGAGGRTPEHRQAALPSLAKQNSPPPSPAQGFISSFPAKEVRARPAKIPGQQKERGWFVQIGSFTQQKNAQRVRDKAGSLGYRAFIITVTEGTKTIYRVQVGPEVEANRAKKLKQELEHRLQVKAFLISPVEG